MIYDTMSEIASSPDAPRPQILGKEGRAVLDVALELAAESEPDRILHLVVSGAAEVTAARYAALSVYDETGQIDRFIHHGLDHETIDRIGALPEGRGLLGHLLVADGPVRLDDLTSHPASCGFPAHHPPMRTFLGVPVRWGERRFGNLYLTEKKRGGAFDEQDEQAATVLAAFAAAAIEAGESAASRAQAEVDRDLLTRVIAAQEAERARVSRDLHDQIGQALTSVLLGQRLVLDALAGIEHPGRATAMERAEDVRTLTADALSQVRRLAFELRPIVLDDIGLVAAVRRLASDLAARHGFEIHIELSGLSDTSRFDTDVETIVYRVIQEALTNVVRHAGATRVQIRLTSGSDAIRADVIDDGAGFEQDELDDSASLGLNGMIERAVLIDGAVEILSEPGRGTSVHLEVPIG